MSSAGSDRSRLDEARVVESFGRHVIVETRSGERLPARLFGRRLATVCGDRVLLQATSSPSDEARVVEVLPRDTLLARTDSRGRTEPLAANLSLLAVLIAPEPPSDPFIADRYLAGAAYAGLDAVVILNKADLEPATMAPVRAMAAEYAAAGYRVLEVSARDGAGLEALRALLRDQVTMLVGQSGVGKSTLSNALVPASQRETRELSTATGEGRHTTVSAALHRLPSGGELIDTPGVRDYAPAPVPDAGIQRGWPEILALAPHCRFNDCLHLREPGCAVTTAVAAGQLPRRRYESYKRLVNLMRSLRPAYERTGPGRPATR
jgi:ribosome biogenesis GTPase